MTTDVEDGEDVQVTQRMALDALADYAKAHKAEKEAKATKEALSKAILKPYLAANPTDVLYDGESELEASLSPHSAPRWLDTKGMNPATAFWALEQGYFKPDLGKIDKAPESQGMEQVRARIKPGGEGTPRLKVSKRGED